MRSTDLAALLLAAPDDPTELLRRADPLTPDQLEGILEEAAQRAQSDPKSALVLLDAVELTADTLGAPQLRPAAHYLRARLTLEAGQPDNALALIETARSEYLNLGLHRSALRVDLGRMHVLDDLGRHAEAESVGRAMLVTLERLPPDEDLMRLRASALGNIGVALGFTGRHEAALQAYQDAASAWRDLGSEADTAIAVANQGIELAALGRPTFALARYGAALRAFDAAGDLLWTGKCLGHRGEALSAAGRFIEALAAFSEGHRLLDEVGVHTEAWRLAIEMAATFMELGLLDEAESVLRELEPKLSAAGLVHDLALVNSHRGQILARTGRLDAAGCAHTEAARLYAQVSDPHGQARAMLDLSRCREPQAAIDLAEQAQLLLSEAPQPGVQCLAALRLVDLHADDCARAEPYLHEAEVLAEQLDLPQLRQTVQQRWGALRLLHGDLEAAIIHLERAVSMAQSSGESITDAALRRAYANSRNRAQDELMQALLQRGAAGDESRVAALADAAKGRTVLNLLNGSLVPHRSPSDASTQALSAELDTAYSELFTADLSRQAIVRATIDSLERRISIREVLDAPGRTARSSVQADVPPSVQTSSVAYHLVADEVIAFVTVRGRTILRRGVSDRATVLRLLDDLSAHLGGHAVEVIAHLGSARILACQRVLQALHLAIFAPVVELLGPEEGGPTPLLIVPHGPLHHVPFHALHDGRRYLIEDRIITIAPSLAVAQHAAATAPHPGPTLIVGVSDPSLPFVDTEAQGVAEVIGDAIVLSGDSATLSNVRALAPGSGLIHLACHGLFRPENAAFSSIKLADRWVRPADIADLDLVGLTLVLSACETGRVDSTTGDEAIGLASGFLAAGVRTVVVSQWMTGDRSTADLMEHMHGRLAAGDHPPAALRAAQLATMVDHPHPFHWAPFIACGAPMPTEKQQ